MPIKFQTHCADCAGRILPSLLNRGALDHRRVAGAGSSRMAMVSNAPRARHNRRVTATRPLHREL